MEPSERDAFEMLRLDSAEWPDGHDALEEALRTFDPEQPAPLLSLLADPDPWARHRGLRIFGELGRRGFVALDAALASVSDPSLWARSHILDGVLCFTARLEPRQLAQVLNMAGAPETLIRAKVSAVLGAAPLEVILRAVAGMTAPVRPEHERGLRLLQTARAEEAQSLGERAAADGGIVSSYAIGALERMARSGVLRVAPTGGDDLLLGNARRLVARRQRSLRSSGRR